MRLFTTLVRQRFSQGKDFDAGQIVCHWAREAMSRENATNLDLSILHRTLIGDRQHSEEVLSSTPSHEMYGVGPTKLEGLKFLAPNTLVITDGEEWQRLRVFNERVLGGGLKPKYARQVLSHVRRAFLEPVKDQRDISRAMGRAMMGVVFGDQPDPGTDPGKDARVLFGVVANPLKRKTVGWFYNNRRERYYAYLRRRWEEAKSNNSRCLLTTARRAAADLGIEQEIAIQQIPNWMFTFTGSGAGFLTRTLAMIVSRADVQLRVVREIADAGPVTNVSTYDALPYLDACFHETGRLFPPVASTFHHAPVVPNKRASELVHWFPLLQRDDTLGPSTQDFQPERWLAKVPDAASAASNLFLRGPRVCAGRELILFVCRAAAVRLIVELQQTGRGGRLSHDPLPISFPSREARFR